MFKDFFKEIKHDLKEDLKTLKSFNKKDILEGLGIIAVVATMIANTILAILIWG